MLNVEQVIREVSGVYEALTGKPIGQARTDLPPEVDPSGHVETRYREFKTLVSAMGRTSQPQAQPTAAPSFAPAMDVIELEREVRCELDLPGVTRDRVSVSVVGEYVGLLVRTRISRIVSVLNRSATLDVSTADRMSE